MSTSQTCAKCQKPLTSRFEIKRFDADGRPVLAVALCSISCLIPWAYQYATFAGTMAVGQVRHQVSRLLGALKGGSGK